MKRRSPWLLMAAAGLILTIACNKDTAVGTDLLDQDRVSVKFADTLRLQALTVPGDSAKTFDPTTLLGRYFIGNMNDPYFGNLQSGLYLQFRPDSIKPDFSDASIDSIVLHIAYDSAGFYTPPSWREKNTLEVYRVTELLDNTKAYYSDKTFATEPMPVATTEFVPTLDSVTYAFDTFSLKIPHLGIKLPFGTSLEQDLKSILADTAKTRSGDEFVKYFNGLYFKISKPTRGLIGLNLTKRVPLNVNTSLTNLLIYYTKNGTRRILPLSIGNQVSNYSVRVLNFKHDYSGSAVAGFLNNVQRSDSLLFLQGAGGPELEIRLPDLKSLGSNVIINKAELVFTVQADTTLLVPVRQMLVTRWADTAKVLIKDIVYGSARNAFGGALETYQPASGDPYQQYRLNLSAYAQDLWKGGVGNVLYVSVDGKAQNPNRVILCGPRHPKYPLKLNLTYTVLK